MKLSELAPYAGTELKEVLRDCDIETVELCAEIHGNAALTFLGKEKFLPALENPGIAAVICTPELAPKIPVHIRGVLLSDEPKFAFYCLYNYVAERNPLPIKPTVIAKSACISPAAYVAPYNVVIGENTIVEEGAIIQEYSTLGNNVRICAGTIVGTRSFSPARYRERAVTLKDRGCVIIEDDVEICAQCGIARGILDADVTRLGRGTKLDNYIHVGHGTQIGPRTFIAACAAIAGNCRIGKDVWLGVNVTISNRIHIGDGARISLGAVVTKHVPAGQTVSGNFAIEHGQFMRNLKKSLIQEQTEEKCPWGGNN